MLFAPLKTGLGARLQLLRAQPPCRRRSSNFCLHLDQLAARRMVPGHLLRRDAIRLADQVRTRARPSPVLRVSDKTRADRIERSMRDAATGCSSSMDRTEPALPETAGLWPTRRARPSRSLTPRSRPGKTGPRRRKQNETPMSAYDLGRAGLLGGTKVAFANEGLRFPGHLAAPILP